MLTDLTIPRLKPGYHWDGTLPAFGIRVGKRARTFVVVQSGNRTTIGRWPELSLREARKRAHRVLGSDPTDRTDFTSEEALAEYIESSQLRKRTVDEYARLLKHIRLPPKLSQVTPHLLLDQIGQLKRTPQEARHTFFAASAFFSWCLDRRYIAQHPLRSLKCPYKPAKRTRVLSDSELRSIWRATASFSTFDRIVRLLILTGQRRSEIAAIDRQWIADDALTFPASVTKNKHEHRFPLTANARKVLIRPPSNGAARPTTQLLTFNAWSVAKARLDKESGVTGWVLHDLRRTFSTKMAEWQICPPHITERLLNHVTGTETPIARLYNRHTYFKEMRTALDAYESRLLALFGEFTLAASTV